MSHLLPLLAVAALLSAAPDGWLGVFLGGAERPTVAEVVPGSPAADAGVRVGDVIVAVAGHSVRDVPQLVATMRGLKAGQRVRVVVERDGATKVFDVELAERPADGGVPGQGHGPPGGAPPVPGTEPPGDAPPAPGSEPAAPSAPWLGTTLEERSRGIVVFDVAADGPFAHAGLRPGDRLLVVEGRPVRAFADLDAVLAPLRPGAPLRVAFERGERTHRAVVTTADWPSKGARDR